MYWLFWLFIMIAIPVAAGIGVWLDLRGQRQQMLGEEGTLVTEPSE